MKNVFANQTQITRTFDTQDKVPYVLIALVYIAGVVSDKYQFFHHLNMKMFFALLTIVFALAQASMVRLI